MKIVSLAGQFDIKGSHFDVEENQLVLVGSLSIWGVRVYMTPQELAHLLLRAFTPKVLLFALKFPFLLLRREPPAGQSSVPQ